MQMLKDRGEPIPNEDLFQVAKQIKEKYSYVCSDDLVKEFEKFDHNPEKKFKKFDALNSITGKVDYFKLKYFNLFFVFNFVRNIQLMLDMNNLWVLKCILNL